MGDPNEREKVGSLEQSLEHSNDGDFQHLDDNFKQIDSEIEEIMKLFRDETKSDHADESSVDTDLTPSTPYDTIIESCSSLIDERPGSEVKRVLFADTRETGTPASRKSTPRLRQRARTSFEGACNVNFHSKNAPTISTNEFQNGLSIDFGDDKSNTVGQTRSLPFVIKSSPDDAQTSELGITCIPCIKGINLVMEDASSSVLQSLTPTRKKRSGMDGLAVESVVPIEKGGKVTLWVTWNPIEPGHILENIILEPVMGKQRLCITISGSAGSTKEKPAPLARNPPLSNRAKLRLSIREHLSPLKVAPVRPMLETPNRREKCSFPEDWAEKQTIAFTAWMNYLFYPAEEGEEEKELQQKKEVKADLLKSTVTNHSSLRLVFIQQRLARGRRKALQFFHANEMTKARLAIESEISKGRFSLRVDRDIDADVILREKVVSILLSYSTQWLRIGLETLFREQISQVRQATAKKSKETKGHKKVSFYEF